MPFLPVSEPIQTFLLNFSSMYDDENFRPEGAEKIDFSGLGGTTCYCDPDSESSIREALRDVPAAAVHWIDNGDYHYLSLFFLEKLSEPFALMLFDNHSDDQPCAFDEGCLSCGSWVARARETLPMMREVHWVRKELPDIEPGLPVYVSVDKDVLSDGCYSTDWDQGRMTLSGLKSMLGTLAATRRILGIDVCGGLPVSKGARAEDLSLNLKTDSDLHEFLIEGRFSL